MSILDYFRKEYEPMTDEADKMLKWAEDEAKRIVASAKEEALKIRDETAKLEKAVGGKFESAIAQSTGAIDAFESDVQKGYARLKAMERDLQSAIDNHQSEIDTHTSMREQVLALIASIEQSGLVSTLVKDIEAATAATQAGQ